MEDTEICRVFRALVGVVVVAIVVIVVPATMSGMSAATISERDSRRRIMEPGSEGTKRPVIELSV